MIYDTLEEACAVRGTLWDPDAKLGPMFFAVELAGEVGEALNVLKKLEREALGIAGSRASRNELAEELADVQICLINLAKVLDIDLAYWTATKFNRSSDKIGLEVYLKVPE